MKYSEIDIETEAASGELLAALLAEQGIAVEERDATTLLKPEAGRALLVAWCEPAQAEETCALISAVARQAGCEVAPRLRERDEDEWRDVWKAFFKPRCVGAFAIVPSWHADYVPPHGEILLRLDPGRAFGTGGHASTRLCLEALSRLAAAPGFVCERVLDVGCGSGILGIACTLRSPGCRVVAVDVDPTAAEVTRENAEENHVAARIEAGTTPLAEVPGQFDVVFANIQADVLERLAPELARHLAAGGALIASGLLAEEAESAAAFFARAGLRCRERFVDEGWAALVLAR